MRSLVSEESVSRVDGATGEVVERVVRRVSVRRGGGASYMFVFPGFGAAVRRLRTLSSVRVLSCLMDAAGWGTGEVMLGDAARARLEAEVGASRWTLRRALRELEGAGFVRVDGDRVVLNSSLCWRGDLRSRDAAGV